jgi:pyridoxamine 5'-phosphate oxidase
MHDIKELLRGLKSLPGPYEPFHSAEVPETPQALFFEWLRLAIDTGVREPHAMTLSTVDSDGRPDARVLILKNVDDQGWHFAITSKSPKGQQIGHAPGVALTFYWPILGRQIRIRGVARDMGPEVAAADFLARPAASRASGLLGRQSEELSSEQELDDGLAEKQKQIENDPKIIAQQWIVYAVRPEVVEFWQGSEQRRHVRLVYRRSGATWTTARLWP